MQGAIPALYARTSDPARTDIVWAEVKRPSDTMQEGGSGQVDMKLPRLTGKLNPATTRWEFPTDLNPNIGTIFSEAGKYSVIIYGMGTDASMLTPQVATIYVNTPTNQAPTTPTLQIPDNAVQSPFIIFQWSSSTDPEKDPVTYTLDIYSDNNGIGNLLKRYELLPQEGTYLDAYLETMPHDDSIYLFNSGVSYWWKVTAIDDKGMSAPSVPRKFTYTPQNDLPGLIKGTVKESASNAPIVGASITAGTATVTSLSNGAFIMLLPRGNYTITATANGIPQKAQTAVISGTVVYVDFSFQSNTSGVCGTSDKGSFSIAPTTNLCTTGTPSTVTGTGPWNWTCTGSNGGTPATCSASIQTWTIGIANSGSGTVSCSTPVNNGATATCTVAPATGYQLATFTDNSIDKKSAVTGGSYSLTNVTASHAIVATFSPTKPKVFLGANDNFTINTSGTTLYGNTGNNTATIATGTTGVTLDQNIGGINLTGTAGSYKFKQTGNIINVYDTTDNLIVSAPVQGDSDGTVLSFTNGITSASAKLVGGVMKLGGATVSTNTATIITPVTTTSAATTPTTTNAKVFLGADNSFNVGNSGTTVYGNTGKGIVTIASGISGVNLDQNIERINFTGLSSSYKFKQTGNLINVYDTADTLIVKVPVQGDADGTILSFGNQGTASAKLSGGVMTLGGKTVSPIVATILTPTLTPL